MSGFRYIDDVESWLEPMSYQAFWDAVMPLELDLLDKSLCDDQIECGDANPDSVLIVLKALARTSLTERHNLEWKPSAPWLKLVS
ncbi:hypothetical protein [uncultured Cohaesibacter sp.]|uniref:hypothetical protein n=1 Tax=uncultured Cohaesibacter sp. TaxID=1002546 RepID=UPI0029316F40|nr:hypothetical protein [uncultured Cohaesibacter sp.]